MGTYYRTCKDCGANLDPCTDKTRKAAPEGNGNSKTTIKL